MTRTLLVCAALLAAPAFTLGQPPKETVVKIELQPARVPKPALKYQLLPELREMNPGNPVQGYLKCFMEQNHFFHHKTVVDQREKWLETPLKDLPVKELRGYGGHALRQADYAARLDTPDWQTLLQIKREGHRLLLPEVQQLRSLAAALKVRFRGEVADRRFDDALVTARTMFALSRHLGEHPTMIGELVGMSVANMACETLEEMVAQPGSPSLFWALTDLPRPFIELRKGAQSERMFLDREFEGLAAEAPMTEGQVRKVVDRLRDTLKVFAEWGIRQKVNVLDVLEARAKDGDHVATARTRLVDAGLAEAGVVKQFLPMQVVLLDEKLAYEARRDDMLKLLGLPYWQAQAVAAPAQERILLGDYLVAGMKVQAAQARLDRRLAILRCVEALRLHAAENGGKLPARLEDVKLPLPVDPVTGRPFPYSVEGTTATLRGTPPAGMEKVAPFNVRYEVTITK